MKHSNAKSFSYYMTPQQQATQAETKLSPKSLAHTGGQGCVHGSRTTSQDARYASKTKTLLTAHEPHYTASPPWKTHSHSNRSPWISSPDCHPIAPTVTLLR